MAMNMKKKKNTITQESRLFIRESLATQTPLMHMYLCCKSEPDWLRFIALVCVLLYMLQNFRVRHISSHIFNFNGPPGDATNVFFRLLKV